MAKLFTHKKRSITIILTLLRCWVNYWNAAVVPQCPFRSRPVSQYVLPLLQHTRFFFLFNCVPLPLTFVGAAGGGCPIAVRARGQELCGVGGEARRPHRREDSKRQCFARPGTEEEGETILDVGMVRMVGRCTLGAPK